jgi:6-hydroxycyclohex-1-ene-1-carbonyl-CoA dehydrogenase
MALDASAFGSWGCSPQHYPAVIDLVLSGAVQVSPFVESVPMEDAGELLAAMAAGAHRTRRPVLVPKS